MEYRLDLHVHSERSPDGRMGPEDIARRAMEKGLQAVALCDHGTGPSFPEAPNGFVFIPGVELATERGHLLGLFVEKPVSGGTFAESVRAIHEAGGLAVMAHPFEHRRDGRALDDILPLLDGIEVINARADRKNRCANRMAAELADRTGLLYTAGSDAHVEREIGNAFVCVEAEELTVDALRRALCEGAVRAEGWDAHWLDTARSRWMRLRRERAGLRDRLTGLLFACKCAAQDCIRNGRKCHVYHR